MALTSSKMGLRVWNLLADLYDHTQLADNMLKIDLHDHTPGRGVQIPTEGLADGSVTNVKLAGGLTATPLDGSVTANKLAPGSLSFPAFASGQIVTGRVNADGSTAAGTHFTSARTGVGVYTITYTTPFAAAPFLIARPSDATDATMDYPTSTASGATIHARLATSLSTPVDSIFYFLAVAML